MPVHLCNHTDQNLLPAWLYKAYLSIFQACVDQGRKEKNLRIALRFLITAAGDRNSKRLSCKCETYCLNRHITSRLSITFGNY